MPRYEQALLVSCEIPWDENEQFLEEPFRHKIGHMLALGFRRMYIFGTAGEGHAVDTARFEQVAQAFHEETAGKAIDPQVGVIALSTAQFVERIAIAYQMGFRMFQISLPSWGALNDHEVLRFFTGVCGAFPECRFLHYNLSRTKRLLSGADYRRIIGEVPNLVATKNTSPSVDHTIDLMRHCPELQHFFGEWTFPTGTLWGECSLLSSWAALFPAKTAALFSHAKAGRTAELFKLHQEYMAVVLNVIEPMRGHPMMDGAFDKVIARLGGLEMPSRLLSPYDSFPEEIYEQCRTILHTRYPDWAPQPDA